MTAALLAVASVGVGLLIAAVIIMAMSMRSPIVKKKSEISGVFAQLDKEIDDAFVDEVFANEPSPEPVKPPTSYSVISRSEAKDPDLVDTIQPHRALKAPTAAAQWQSAVRQSPVKVATDLYKEITGHTILPPNLLHGGWNCELMKLALQCIQRQRDDLAGLGAVIEGLNEENKRLRARRPQLSAEAKRRLIKAIESL